MRWAMAAAAVAMGFALAAQAAPSPEQAKAEQALQTGKALYALDEAAWGSTDDLAQHVAPDAFPAEGGWVAEPLGQLIRVTYFGVKDGAPFAFYQADMDGRRTVARKAYGVNEDRTLAPETLRLVRAHMAATPAVAGEPRCNDQPRNVLVLPAGADRTAVYVMTPMTALDVYPLGGHYLVMVDDAGKVVGKRAFAKSCFDVRKPPQAASGDPGVGIVTHMLDRAPTEMHAFWALRMHAPLIVLTEPGVMWMVSADGVEGPEPIKKR